MQILLQNILSGIICIILKFKMFKRNHLEESLRQEAALTCSRPAVSPTGFKWFLRRSLGVREECRANMIMAKSGTLSPLRLAAYRSRAAASMCSLTASHRRTSSSGSLLSRASTTHSRFSQPIKFITCQDHEHTMMALKEAFVYINLSGICHNTQIHNKY